MINEYKGNMKFDKCPHDRKHHLLLRLCLANFRMGFGWGKNSLSSPIHEKYGKKILLEYRSFPQGLSLLGGCRSGGVCICFA